MKKYVYEFIGTFFLVFTIGMTVMEPHSAGMLAPLAIGTVLTAIVFAGGHVSGAHYNPAITLSVFLKGKFSKKDLGMYWLAQLLAGVLAAYLTLYCKGGTSQNMIALDPTKALLVEFLFTFALCFVVLNVAVAKETKGNSYFGLAIGLIVLAGAYAVGTISGAAFNPAVALGVSIMQLSSWSNLWIFIVANLLGGAFAAYVFKSAHSNA